MKKLRWAMDGGFWELDVSTPVTLEGVGRAVPGQALPLGMCSRGSRLSRPKQIHFFQRFMSIPFLPSFSPPHSLSLQRVLTFPLPPPAAEYWFATLLGQFNLHKFLSSVKENGLMHPSESSWLKSLGRHLCNKSLYALNFCSELLITPDDTLLLGIEAYGDNKTTRKKALLHHKFLHHNLTAEASWPQLFVDDLGSYWDVPFSMAIDLASVASDSGASYHFCVNHNAGQPKQHEDQLTGGVPMTLLPGLLIKNAFSFKKNVDIWRSKAPKLKMVQPFDIFLSNPHISASGILGAVLTACIGDNLVISQGGEDSLPFKGLTLRAPVVNSTILADMFASISLSVQHGNFQRLFLDLTRFYARMDFPSGSKFISGATHLAQDLYNSCQPSVEAIQAICPKATLSLQQQIAGPFSFRVDSGVALDYKNSGWHVSVNDPVFAIEYALQVLGSAKAVAWYSPKQQEFMIELRFFET
ncbi:protein TRIGALACTOSYLDIACYLGLYCEROL 4, chloroplastic [Camellia sinensis]|uniref:protein TRIGALACTOSYLDIACYLGLYCEROL 4, chloroplastic n=1 Tax=Camellia sinensis TaxID=4442 RepID=UPI001036ABFD|nr:protein TRIGALACTOSYLDIACYLGLYCEROL 4, chloroplastic [Camellia sinensis]